MAKRSFVVVAHQGQEKRAKRELENQEFEVYLPMCIAEWARKPRIRPFLGAYFFVWIDLDDRNTRWRSVYSTLGVRTVLSAGNQPQPVPDWIVDEIKAREVDGIVRLPPRMQCKHKPGDRVFVRGSAMEAVFEEAVDEKRAAVFLSLLGRSDLRTVVPIAKLASLPNAAA